MLIRAGDIIEASGGRLLQGEKRREISGFAIDSRQVEGGDFFVPFRGERTDGHRYIADAAGLGAAGSFIEAGRVPDPDLPGDFLLIEVESSLEALQKTASFHRGSFDLPVVGITGSSGKTTTKDFTAGVLSARYNVLKTTGNLNNEIGLPLTVLRLDGSHRAAVLEMGMDAPGEITVLCEIARPSIGIITNIGEAHLELLGSIEAIARAKGELLDYLGSGGIAVLNGDDSRLLQIGKRYPGKVYYYGFNQGDIKGIELSQRGENHFFRARFPDKSEGWFQSPLPGRESAGNALAALTVGYILGLSPAQMGEGLLRSRTTAGRLEVVYTGEGLGVIDDTYNANPSSVRSSLGTLTDLGGNKTIAVLGDMLELGPTAKEAHREIGRFAASCGIGGLVTVGSLARYIAEGAGSTLRVFTCSTNEEVPAVIARFNPGPNWYLLVKGSRGMRMEEIVRLLTGREGAEK